MVITATVFILEKLKGWTILIFPVQLPEVRMREKRFWYVEVPPLAYPEILQR